MKKKYIPAIITLTAGLIDCIMSLGKGMTNMEYVRQLLIVLVVFFILGLFIRFFVEKGLGVLADKTEDENPDSIKEEDEKENIEQTMDEEK